MSEIIKIEKAIIGAIMTKPGTLPKIAGSLKPHMLSDSMCRAIYEAICEDPALTDVSLLRARKPHIKPYDIAVIMDEYSGVSNIEIYVKEIAEAWMAREFEKTLNTDLIADVEDIFDRINAHQKNVASIIEEVTKGAILSDKDSLKYYEQYLSEENARFYTGITYIDDAYQIHSKGLSVIAARPSMGKTALAISIAVNQPADTNVLFFSLEVSANNLKDNLRANKLRINKDVIRDKKKLTAENKLKLISFSMPNLYIVDDLYDIQDIINAIRAFKVKNKGKLMVVIDYLQLVKNRAAGKNVLRTYLIEENCIELKKIAKELDLSMICLAQIGRGAEARGGEKKPTLLDLKDSAGIEQNADLVLAIHRPEYYGFEVDENGTSTAGVAEIIGLKQRDGKRLVEVNINFQGEYSLFSSSKADDFLNSSNAFFENIERANYEELF